MIYNVCATVRAHEGEILLHSPTQFGYIIRAEVRGYPCRIILPLVVPISLNIPSEPSCLTHIITSVENLNIWLSSILSLSNLVALGHSDTLSSIQDEARSQLSNFDELVLGRSTL